MLFRNLFQKQYLTVSGQSFHLFTISLYQEHIAESQSHPADRACEAGVSKAREAGDSVKPGAQAPGSEETKAREPAKRATACKHLGCRPFHGLRHIFCFGDPGVCTPGFMLTPASRAGENAVRFHGLCLRLLRRLCD